MEICVANCKNGNPCQWPVMPGSSYCFNHDPRPEIAQRRREGRKRGGIMHRQYLAKPSTPVKLDTLEDIRDLTFRVTRELREGKIAIKAANSLMFACRTALRAAALLEGKAEAEAKMAMPQVENELAALDELIETGRNRYLTPHPEKLLRLMKALKTYCEMDLDRVRKRRDAKRWAGAASAPNEASEPLLEEKACGE